MKEYKLPIGHQMGPVKLHLVSPHKITKRNAADINISPEKYSLEVAIKNTSFRLSIQEFIDMCYEMASYRVLIELGRGILCPECIQLLITAAMVNDSEFIHQENDPKMMPTKPVVH